MHATGGWIQHVWYWVEIHTGTLNEPGPFYGFWSGFGSDIGEIAIVGAVYSMYRKHNCGAPGCWRIGKHPTEDGMFHMCRHHHPDLMGKKKFSLEEIHAHHRAAKAVRTAPPMVINTTTTGGGRTT